MLVIYQKSSDLHFWPVTCVLYLSLEMYSTEWTGPWGEGGEKNKTKKKSSAPPNQSPAPIVGLMLIPSEIGYSNQDGRP